MPGGFTTGILKNSAIQLVRIWRHTEPEVMAAWPVRMVSRSRTVIAARFGLTTGGRCSGKKDTTLSSSPKRPSATAMPTAQTVTLLVSECVMWRRCGP